MKSYSKIIKYPAYELVEIFPKKQNMVFIDGVFYQPSYEDYARLIKEDAPCEVTYISDNVWGTILTILLITVSLLLAPFLMKSASTEDFSVFVLLLLLIINVALHEAAHFFALKLFLRRAHLKVGFHLYLPFPSFYVDTTYALFLPHFKRITVFLAGMAANAAFLIAVYFLSLPLAIYSGAIYSLFLFNLIPILKNDACYVMRELRNKPYYANKKMNPHIEALIRGIIMVGIIILFQCLFSALT